MNALILYFSGTGNTRNAAGEFRAGLLKRGYSVAMHSTEEKADLTKIPYDVLLVGFPKYYEYPLLPMLQYLKRNLPKSGKTVPTLAFCTQAGGLKTDFSGLGRLLRKKNHRLTVGVSFPYANNMMIFKAFHATEPAELAANRENIRKQIDPLLDDFLAGKEHSEQTKAWQRPLILLVAKSCFHVMPAFFMRFSTDESCTGCGLCAKRCPRKNIRMENGRPVFQKHCLFCMRCINSCPVNAIRYSGQKCRQYRCEPFTPPAETAAGRKITPAEPKKEELS